MKQHLCYLRTRRPIFDKHLTFHLIEELSFLAFTHMLYILLYRAMSSCTMAYPTSIKTTDVTWSPEMTANWMATWLLWRYNLENVVLFHHTEISTKLFHLLNICCCLQNPSKECEPYRTSDNLPIAPCGAIANSLFNGKWDMLNNLTFFSLEM